MVQVSAGQKSEAVLDGVGALLFILVVSDVLLQRFDDDLLLGSAAASVDGALEEVVGQLECSGGGHLMLLLMSWVLLASLPCAV